MKTTMARSTLLVLAFLSAGLSGCSGDDDDDDGGTPDPITPTGCQIVWVTRDPPAQTDTFDYYVVDAPVGSWETGDEGYFVGDPTGVANVTGAWVDDYDLVDREWVQAAVATSGIFTLVLATSGDAALEPGQSVEFDDVEAQAYFLLGSNDELTVSIGDSGTGSFDGEWSVPGSPDVEEGSGTITILYLGSDMTLGVDVAFAQCYEDAAFAPSSRIERVRRAGDRAGALLRR